MLVYLNSSLFRTSGKETHKVGVVLTNPDMSKHLETATLSIGKSNRIIFETNDLNLLDGFVSCLLNYFREFLDRLCESTDRNIQRRERKC